MTLSSSLVGLQPGWDLPPALQHADLQPEKTLAGDRRETQLPASPLPGEVPYCLLQHRLPGLSRAAGDGVQIPTHVLQLDPLNPAVPGPWGQGVLQSLLWAALACAACKRTLLRPQAALVTAAREVSPGALSVSLQLEPTSRCRPTVPGPSFGALEGSMVRKLLRRRSAGSSESLPVPVTPSLLLSIRPVVRSPTPPLPRKEEGGRFR